MFLGEIIDYLEEEEYNEMHYYDLRNEIEEIDEEIRARNSQSQAVTSDTGIQDF